MSESTATVRAPYALETAPASHRPVDDPFKPEGEVIATVHDHKPLASPPLESAKPAPHSQREALNPVDTDTRHLFDFPLAREDSHRIRRPARERPGRVEERDSRASVTIHIGRIDVAAVTTPPVAPKPIQHKSTLQKPSLDAYLQRRDRGTS